MGSAWWDKKRREAYRERDYHCWACGVHKDEAIIKQWLEAHERYRIDYVEGRMTVTGIAALCHACHAFVHNGRTFGVAVHAGGRKAIKRAFTIYEHGFNVLGMSSLPDNQYALYALWKLSGWCEDNRLHSLVPPWAKDKLNGMSLETLMIAIAMREENIAWQDWRLEFNGQLYEPLYANELEWEKAMSDNNDSMVFVDRVKMLKKLESANSGIAEQMGGLFD
jgi:hypothetical protein